MVGAEGSGGDGGDAGAGGARMTATSGRWVSLRGELDEPTPGAANNWPADATGVGFIGAEVGADRKDGAKIGAVTMLLAIAA